jgi:hypothetical protein
VIRSLSRYAILVTALLAACGRPAANVARLLRRAVGIDHPTKLTPGSLPNRFFTVEQRSYWIPDGADSSVVPVADTLMILSPDSSGGDSIRFSGEQGCCDGALKLERDTARSRIDVRILNNWHDPESAVGGLLLLSPDWVQVIRQRVPGAWRDSGVVRHHLTSTDSSVLVFTRQGRAWGWVSYAGARWLRMSATRTVTVSGRHTVDRDLSPTGTPVDFRYSGAIAERFLYEPQSGFVDSVEARGTLEGRLVYHEATGKVDSVLGAQRIERRGSWRYYAEFQPDDVVFVDSARPAVAQQQERYVALKDSATYADSALVLRIFQLVRGTQSPALRWPLDEAFRRLAFNRDVSSLMLTKTLQQGARPQDVAVLGPLVEYPGEVLLARAIPLQTATGIVDQLSSLRVERRNQVNRETFFGTLATLLRSPMGIEPGAGEHAARLAQQTDDAAARDLLLLLAYKSDPARYQPLLERLADRRPGSYGSIARAYAQGNIAPDFYGAHPDSFELTWTGRPFPGLVRPWREQVAYFEQLPDGAALRRAQDPKSGATWLDPRPVASPDYLAMGRAVQLLLRARGIDANAALAGRFTSETDPHGRIVWAHYLLSMGDTTPLPWLRGAYRGSDRALATDALRLMELHARSVADTLVDPMLLGSIQNAVLDCVTGRSELADSAGASERDCSTHGEALPHALQVDGLAQSTVSRWKGTFTLRSHAEFLRRARADGWGGSEMAITLSPVRRIENRYYIDYAFAPGSGEGCLCGYGGSFVLVEQRGRWVVVQSSGWIS